MAVVGAAAVVEGVLWTVVALSTLSAMPVGFQKMRYVDSVAPSTMRNEVASDLPCSSPAAQLVATAATATRGSQRVP